MRSVLPVVRPDTELDLAIPQPKLWSPDSPFLYGLRITLTHNGATNDSLTSYFGMRKISVLVTNGAPRILLNNQLLFGMGTLDQGFWPDGIYTAPTDDALRYDLQEEKALGFNLIRKHVKVERQRWYYWADTLGLMVWQDMPTCNSYTGNPDPPAIDPLQFEAELTALVQNHRNNPAIVMWDLFNEGQGEEGSANGVGQSSTASLVQLVKALDPSRLVNQASGGTYFGVGDVLDNHSYPNPGDPTGSTQAAVDGEFGGLGFLLSGHLWSPSSGWSYIIADNLADLATLYDPFTDQIVRYKPGGLNAAVYTQITDVETECDGLLTYDRVVKPDPARIAYSNQKAISGVINPATGVITANTFTVPSDYIGYWALDETNGTVAIDLSGHGNNGTVVDAAWNPHGKINGCLSFNGSNSYVQVNRDITNDFSIAFWVQTTATANAGSWREGSGLVDGSVSEGANDFGVALAGNELAFGTGNPDTTLLSTNSINDGLWHYCVATRAQSTGLLQLYVDGSLQATGSGSAMSLTAPSYLRLGARQSGGGFFNGNLDEVKIYARALGNLEIAALYADSASSVAAPTNMTASPGNAQVALTWWEAPIATSYNVSRSVSSGGPYTFIADVNTPGYTDTNVVNGTRYYYVVAAVDSAGAGAYSAEVSAMPVTLWRGSPRMPSPG